MNHSHDLPTSLELMAPEARRELLVAYLDGELSPEATRHVTAWLDENPAALREVEHWRQTWTLLDHYEDEPVPADFAARVFDAVGLEPAEREGRVLRMAWYRRPLATAAAVVLAVGATVFVMKQGGADDPSSPPVATIDVVSVLRDVPDDQLSELLLNADALLSVDAESLEAADEETVFSDGASSDGALGG